MVSKNHPNNYSISIPADWSLPKFHLGQHIQATTVLPNATRIQTGEISGIEYIRPDSVWVAQHGLKPGWYYSIAVDANDPWYSLAPHVCVEESDICAINERIEAPALRL
jgi:hypothetical protein